jgi:hypothetical protein
MYARVLDSYLLTQLLEGHVEKQLSFIEVTKRSNFFLIVGYILIGEGHSDKHTQIHFN